MIVRVFQVSVYENKVDAFQKFFTETAMPLMQRQPGLVSLTAGLPRPETPTDFCMVMVWDNVESLRAFAGDDWQQPHIAEDEVELVRERRLAHYELA